jgi:single-strand DNA-binding protein
MISGNLTRDPELRSTAGGTSVLNFGVAVNDRRKNQQTGEWEEYANFINCVMFGKRADALAQYLTKGQKVAIEGKLSYSQWESQQGEKRSKVEVLVDEIEFMSSRGEGGGGGGRTFEPPQAADLPSDDEIPF